MQIIINSAICANLVYAVYMWFFDSHSPAIAPPLHPLLSAFACVNVTSHKSWFACYERTLKTVDCLTYCSTFLSRAWRPPRKNKGPYMHFKCGLMLNIFVLPINFMVKNSSFVLFAWYETWVIFSDVLGCRTLNYPIFFLHVYKQQFGLGCRTFYLFFSLFFTFLFYQYELFKVVTYHFITCSVC